MKRRDFLRTSGLLGIIGNMPSPFRLYAAPSDYSGTLLVTVQADGGWDVTSFCDPKANVPGEPKINNWATAGEIQQAGNLRYAPFAANQAFFDKYYRHTLVINGIDAQTNSHTAGVTHNWSGRISEGYPSLTALFASIKAPDLPVAYINNGGYAETGGLIRHTRLEDAGPLENVIHPNAGRWNPDAAYLHSQDWELVRQARFERRQSLVGADNLMPRRMHNRAAYMAALENAGPLADFAAEIARAGDLQEPRSNTRFYSTIHRQAQLALLAMKSGVSVAADIVLGGFDTHASHDDDHVWLLEQLTSAIDYLWEYAGQLGLADRLVVLVDSDFARTPHYNDVAGKDHWPIGSALVMQQNAAWGNRVVGWTDGGHNTFPINPETLQRDDQGGTIIYPKHVMQALRVYLDLDTHVYAQTFRLADTELFDFFNPAKSTV